MPVLVTSFCILHPESELHGGRFGLSGARTLEIESAASTTSGQGTQREAFTFDQVFAPKTSQERVFQEVARVPVLGVLDSFESAAFLALGASGGGKTFAITGGAKRFADRGLIPRSISALFEALGSRSDREDFVVSVSFYEIYKDAVIDLLAERRRRISIEPNKGESVLVGLLSQRAATESDAYQLLFHGDSNRHFERLPQNPETSRGHVFYVLQVSHLPSGREAKLSFIDLAAPATLRNQATASIIKSMDALNASLSAILLGQTPSFDGSVLTQLLQPWIYPAPSAGPVHLALICPIRYSDDQNNEMHEWLLFARLIREALEGSDEHTESNHPPSLKPSSQPRNYELAQVYERPLSQALELQQRQLETDGLAATPAKAAHSPSLKPRRTGGSVSTANVVGIAVAPPPVWLGNDGFNVPFASEATLPPAPSPLQRTNGSDETNGFCDGTETWNPYSVSKASLPKDEENRKPATIRRTLAPETRVVPTPLTLSSTQSTGDVWRRTAAIGAAAVVSGFSSSETFSTTPKAPLAPPHCGGRASLESCASPLRSLQAAPQTRPPPPPPSAAGSPQKGSLMAACIGALPVTTLSPQRAVEASRARSSSPFPLLPPDYFSRSNSYTAKPSSVPGPLMPSSLFGAWGSSDGGGRTSVSPMQRPVSPQRGQTFGAVTPSSPAYLPRPAARSTSPMRCASSPMIVASTSTTSIPAPRDDRRTAARSPSPMSGGSALNSGRLFREGGSIGLPVGFAGSYVGTSQAIGINNFTVGLPTSKNGSHVAPPAWQFTPGLSPNQPLPPAHLAPAAAASSWSAVRAPAPTAIRQASKSPTPSGRASPLPSMSARVDGHLWRYTPSVGGSPLLSPDRRPPMVAYR